MAVKKRILAVCVRLFLEQGYKKTTVAQIVAGANVSNSSFQNIFRAKDGVLTELAEFMFTNQYGVARKIAGPNASLMLIYAVECAIQLTLTELNENLREIYVEAYSHSEALSVILRENSKVLHRAFSSCCPGLTQDDFRTLEIGTAGLARAFMAEPCSEQMVLEQKLETYTTMSLRALCVPEEEIHQVISFLHTLDIREIAEDVMDNLFQAMSVRYSFSLQGIKTQTNR